MMTLPPGYEVTAMREDELASLETWAAEEGWNPGLSDIKVGWATDPEAFVALRHRNEMIGGGSIISYGGKYGFMGLFIMRPDFRRQGLGSVLWKWRRDRLLARLDAGASIGMDGVFEMVPFYERGGFKPAYRDLRYQGEASGKDDPDAVMCYGSDFDDLEAYDRKFFPGPRGRLLRLWMEAPGTVTKSLTERGRVVGYGVARPCRVGYKIGPLFADRDDIARRIVGSLLAEIPGEQVQMDVPEPNAAAVALVTDLGFSPLFGCLRMYFGEQQALSIQRTFAITSMEFG
jgi:GNAT superfamily N-acetyltransferase